MDLYRCDAKTYARTRLFQNDGGHDVRAVSPVEQWIALSKDRGARSETDAIVEAVRKNLVPVEYVVYPDEGHGFSQKKNELDSCSRILHFLDKYLRP